MNTRKTIDVNHTGEGNEVRVDKNLSTEDRASRCAEVVAKRTYGKGGHVRTLRRDCMTMDGSFVHYQAFIGYSPKNSNGTVGHNIWVYVDNS